MSAVAAIAAVAVVVAAVMPEVDTAGVSRRTAGYRRSVPDWPTTCDHRDLPNRIDITTFSIPALELHMQHLNVSAFVVASAILAASFGPVRAENEGSHEHNHHHKMAKRLAEYLNLTDAQRAAYKEFIEARTKAVDDAKTTLCATKPDLSTFETRLTFHQNMLEARVAALKEENPKLLAFYKSLDADQKEKFDQFRNRRDRE
jgi:hypothetical protein